MDRTLPPSSPLVPADLDAGDWSQLAPLFDDLLERPLESASDLERWLVDRSELEAAISEALADRYIAMTCHTDDEAAKAEYLRFVDEIEPRVKPMIFRLNERFVKCSARADLDEEQFRVLNRDLEVEVMIYREENVPLETELSKLDQEYNEICGAMTCDFDGRERTLAQMSRYLEETDRETRETAWTKIASRRLDDADRIESIFDRMLMTRQRVAENAGFENYRDYMFRKMRRFDYTPADCIRFHDACEQEITPLYRELNRQRRELLGVDDLKPWDLVVDARGRPPLRPFEDADDLVDGTERIFGRMDPGLGKLFSRLREPGCLDLDSRKGKAPGGYQYQRDRSRKPFIFMNAAGLSRDVETLLHEGGHAFHSMLCADQPLLHYREAPTEFAEVASMSMELTAHQFLDEFFTTEDAERARRRHLESIVQSLPWIAQIDAFQHWLYTRVGHSRDERRDAWLALDARFGPEVDWSGFEEYHARSWQRQLHLFGVPFYYIEYGIAQLGALQIWLNYRDDPDRAIDQYKAGLSLGGSRPLPELFDAAGAEFNFGRDSVRRLITEVSRELESLPA